MAKSTSTTRPLATWSESGTEIPAMAATGSGRRSPIEGFLMTIATQAAAKPTMPSSQPRIACQPAVSSTGGRSTSPDDDACEASRPTEATVPRPDGTTMSSPMPNRPPMMTVLAATGERNRAAHTASATPSMAATAAYTRASKPMNTPPAITAAAMAGNAIATAMRMGERSGSSSGTDARAAASSRSASTWPSSSVRCSRTSCSRASSSDGLTGSPPPATGAHVARQRGRQVLPGVHTDHLATEGSGRPHGLAVVVVPQEGDDEDRHAGVEQQLQLGRFELTEPGCDEHVVGVAPGDDTSRMITS